MSVFGLGNETWKRGEEEGRKLMEKYTQMEAKYQAKSCQSCREATTRRGGKVLGGRSKMVGRGGAAGLRGAEGSTHGGREEERGKGKIEA